MKVLIVEDEDLAVEKLNHTMTDVEPGAELVGITGSIKGTVEWLRNNPQPDIILMDIELSDGQSFEIFNQVNVDSNVIFTTSYDEYAIKAFRVNSIDYLLKPVQKEDLKQSFEKYKKLRSLSQHSLEQVSKIKSLLNELQGQLQTRDYRKRFLVKLGQKHVSVEAEEIAYFYIDSRSILFKTKDNKKFVTDYKLDEIETMIDPHRFFRINRSFLISIESVGQMFDYVNSRLMLKLKPDLDKEVIVSREKVAEFKKWMGK